MAIPVLLRTRIELRLANYCEARIPLWVRDKVRLTFTALEMHKESGPRGDIQNQGMCAVTRAPNRCFNVSDKGAPGRRRTHEVRPPRRTTTHRSTPP